LLTKDNVIKIADFGLSRPAFFKAEQEYTSEVATLWYRAPEVLLGMSKYSQAVDN